MQFLILKNLPNKKIPTAINMSLKNVNTVFFKIWKPESFLAS